MLRIYLLLGCLVAFTATAAQADWRAGERLTYDVKFGWLKAGQLEFDYTPNVEDYRLTVRAWTGSTVGSLFSVHDRVTAVGAHSDTSFTTSQYRLQLFENDYRADKQVVFQRDAVSATATYDNVREPLPPTTFPDLPADVRDVFSALYALRAQQAEIQVGASFELPIAALDSQYNMTLEVLEQAELKTVFGELPVWQLQPKFTKIGEENAKLGRWMFWVTADERLLPVKIQVGLNFGKFTAQLREIDQSSRAPKTLPLAGQINPPSRHSALLAFPE